MDVGTLYYKLICVLMPYNILMTTTIQYAQWEDLPAEVQSVIAGFTGQGLAAGKSLYELYFYGYNIPHEVGHILRQLTGTQTDRRYDEEMSANLFAVAFWRGRGAAGLILKMEATLHVCLDHMSDPLPPGEDRAEYFNRHQQELIDPRSYGHYQFNMVLSALTQTMSFEQALLELFHHTAPASARQPVLGDPAIGPDLPEKTVAELRWVMDAFGLALPEIGVQRIYTPAIQRVVEG